MTFFSRIAAAPSGAFLALLLAAQASAEGVLKFATLAPEGSTWMKVMADYDRELQAKTAGRLRFKFYPGGVSGDEKDMVRKIRLGQLHAAGLTGVGLGEIAPVVRVLDSPFLFRAPEEVDRALRLYEGDLTRALEAKGFVLLGWTEVGFVHLFTNSPVTRPLDLKAVKMWVWEGDPIAAAAFKAFGIHPIPLSITDVMTSLQTGLVNGVYASPMAALALQWHTKTKFVSPVPLAYAAGAVLVSKKALEGLPEVSRKALKELGRSHLTRLTLLSREENRKAAETLVKEGLRFSATPSPEALKEYESLSAKARRELVGRLYPRELLDKFERSVAELRKSGRAADGKPPKT